jgi:hypothetical protein
MKTRVGKEKNYYYIIRYTTWGGYKATKRLKINKKDYEKIIKREKKISKSPCFN